MAVNYEIRAVLYRNNPRNNIDTTKLDVDYVVHVGVVGDTHNFTNQHDFTITLDKSLTISAAEALITSTADSWLAANYPAIL